MGGVGGMSCKAAVTVEDFEAAVAAAVAAHMNASWARSSGRQGAVVLRSLAEKLGGVMLLWRLYWLVGSSYVGCLVLGSGVTGCC